MKKTAFFCTLGLLLAGHLPAQNQAADTLAYLHQLRVNARFATADNLGNYYAITPENIIEKYSPQLNLLSRYTNNRLGAAARIDATNPMKLLVWYADFRTAVFLDRNLTQLGELNLIQAGYPEVRSIAAAADGNLWLYDEVAFKVKKISPGGAVRFESPALNLLLPGRLQICAIADNGQEVYAADSTQGILQFDLYAQFQQLLPWKNIADFALDANSLAFFVDSTLQIDQVRAIAGKTLTLPASAQIPDARRWLAPRRLLVQNGEFLEVWTW